MLVKYVVIAASAVWWAHGVTVRTHGQSLEKAIVVKENAGDLAPAVQQSRTPTGQAGRVDPSVATGSTQPAAGGAFSDNYDRARTVTISGTVSAVQWVTPQSMLVVNGTDGNRWGFALAPPNQMLQIGLTRNSLKLGDEVVVRGYRATGKEDGCPRDLPTACETLANGALHAAAVTVASSDGTVIFDRALVLALPPDQASGVHHPEHVAGAALTR